MGISDIINKAKRDFFVNKNASVSELKQQKKALMKEQTRLQTKEEVRQLQKENKALRQKPGQERLAALKSGFKNLQKNAQKLQSNKKFSSASTSPFAPSSNPFNPNTMTKAEKPKSEKKRIIINL